METYDYIPLRYLNEFTYCPRLGYLEFAYGEFEENEYTVDGKIKHRWVEEKRGKDGEFFQRMTSVVLSSERLGVIGKIDLLEQKDGDFVPVEYKRGRVPRKQPQGYEPERIQLCAQGLLLRENGYTSSSGIIYYADSHRRVEVCFDEVMVSKTLSLIEEFRSILKHDDPPPPLRDSPKCGGCSLNRICLPDETLAICRVPSPEEGKVRKLIPARDDNLPVYITRPGVSVGKYGDRLILRHKEEEIDTIRLNEISQLCLFGNAQVSSQAMRELMFRGIPVAYFSSRGWFYGIAQSHYSKNAFLRIMQFNHFFDPSRRLEVSRRIVNGKIRNCRTLVRRNLKTQVGRQTVEELGRLANKSLSCSDVQELLGIEGHAARLYFQSFSEMLGSRRADALAFDFAARRKRPATDPVNAMLSYGYSLLLKDCLINLLTVGFDPYIGFYHQPKYGKPALALDLMEEFRPIIVDSVVLTCINNGEVDGEGFISRMGRVSMKDGTRNSFIAAYERRMDSVVKHPLFKYSISYRRVLEVQARMLARYITGEADIYIPFCTR